MNSSKTLDTWVGLFVVAGIAAIFFLGMKVSNLTSFGNEPGYTIFGKFTNSGGLKVRSPVSIAGVRIGRVQSIIFDHDTYESIVTILIEPQYKTIPDDTSASIYTAGLLGEQYISLEAGGSDEYFKQGSEIDLTEPALVLEKLIGQFLFDSKDKKSEE
jgi:phospholipid/cholesterol/gamma-HCH transport system substrate-binding protein